MTAIGRILNRLATKRISERELFESTIRPSDVAMRGRYIQRPYADLVRRYYSTWVYVAASRTAAGVASMPIRVFRNEQKAGKKSVWASRPVHNKRRDVIAERNGRYARKAMADNDSVEEIVDPTHPLVEILAKGNIRDNGYDLIERNVLYTDLTGNGYLAMIDGRAVPYPVELWPLHSPNVYITPDRATFIKNYVYGRGTETERTYEPEDIVHVRGPNPTGDEIYGMGCLAACVMQADLSSAFTAHGMATIENGVQPGLIVTMPGTKAEQREAARIEMERVFKGPAQAGRSMILGGPAEMDVKPWTIGEKEVAYLESQKDARDAIAAAFGMSSALLTMEDAALATANSAVPQWRLMSLIPRSRRIEDKFNESLVPKFREALGDDSLFVAFDTTEKEDMTAVSAKVCAEYGAGIATQNEARRALGYPSVEGGNEFKAAPAMVGTDPTGKPQVAPQGKPAEYTGEDEKTLVVVETKAVPAVTIKASDLVMGHGTNLCRCGDCSIHAKDDRPVNGPKSPTMEERVRAVLADNQPIIMAAINAGEPIEKALLRAKFEKQLIDAVLPGIREMFTRGYHQGNAQIGKRPSLGAFAVEAPDAVAFMEGEANRLASSVTRTYSQAIADAVAQGIKDGKSIPQIAADLQATMPSLNDVRATMIARTETAFALTSGTVTAWQRSGDVAAKEWILGPNPCEFCRAIAKMYNGGIPLADNFIPKGGAIVGVDGGVYVADYKAVFGPALHPNCECVLAPVMRKIPA